MKKLVLFSFAFFAICLTTPAFGQQAKATALLTKAKEQMAQQEYQAANGSFREMLALKTVLPTEMCYYFASTLFMLGQYDNSLRFTEKYMELAGSGGEFYKESRELKALLQDKMATIRNCSHCDTKGYELEACLNCEQSGQLSKSCTRCYGRKQVKCISCEGEGVVIEKNHFEQQTYHTCQRCEGKGIQECPTCKGRGQAVLDCRYCQGSGRTPTTRLCKHPSELP